MKTIRCWDDLAEFGIVPLTGEACGLMYRILCDVTERGKWILEKAFSVAEVKLHDAWNLGEESDPHIGSIMVSPELLTLLSVFALLESGCTQVWVTRNHGVIGIEPSATPSDLETLRQVYDHDLARCLQYAGTAGDRNQHVMSGRIH